MQVFYFNADHCEWHALGYPKPSPCKVPSSMLGAGTSKLMTHLTLASKELPSKQVSFSDSSSPVLTYSGFPLATAVRARPWPLTYQLVSFARSASALYSIYVIFLKNNSLTQIHFKENFT